MTSIGFNGLKDMKIRSKKFVGKRHVCDIEVENTHTFYASGVVVHNCHTFKIARYLKSTIDDDRLLLHGSDDREEVFHEHITSDRPTVLLSPSMTEGVDLYDDRGRFQIVCKVPFPFLGDKVVRKRMRKQPWWYGYTTAKAIVQSLGRSVRNHDDHAVSYILDGDWETFYGKTKHMFPDDFASLIQ